MENNIMQKPEPDKNNDNLLGIYIIFIKHIGSILTYNDNSNNSRKAINSDAK
jgi:hypothetical protein